MEVIKRSSALALTQYAFTVRLPGCKQNMKQDSQGKVEMISEIIKMVG